MGVGRAADAAVERRLLAAGEAALEVFIGAGAEPTLPSIIAAHPAEALGAGAVEFLRDAAQTRVICVNPRGLGGSAPLAASERPALAAMVDEIEAARVHLGCGRVVFWGMSGGGWLGQIYAARHPDALLGLILESACACFCARLADPACVLSPWSPAWRERLDRAGLLAPEPPGAFHGDEAFEWVELQAVGLVCRRAGGPAVLVSPVPVSAELKRAMPALLAVDNRAALERVRVPALVICGTADPIVPLDHARALQRALSGSRFVAIEGAGHVPVSQRSPEVAREVQAFLRALR